MDPSWPLTPASAISADLSPTEPQPRSILTQGGPNHAGEVGIAPTAHPLPGRDGDRGGEDFQEHGRGNARGNPFESPSSGTVSDSIGKDELLDLEAVQRSLGRSRASIYRYTNSDPKLLNPPYNPKTLNPEYRSSLRDPLLFHPNEVARFARDILKMKQVTVEVLSSPQTATQEVLEAILHELKAIRLLLEQRS